MESDSTLLEVLVAITEISSDTTTAFQEKLSRILNEIVGCMHAKKGSIMLLKNRKTLEVVASTNPGIVGVRQSIEEDTPSSWVVKNRTFLYVDRESGCSCRTSRFAHYRGEAFFLAPIVSCRKVIGVVSVTEKMGADEFNQAEREMLLKIIGHVIIALENHRLTVSLRHKQKALRRKNSELKRLEKLRTELFNMLIHDLKGPVSEIIANLDILSYTVAKEHLEFVETAQAGCSTLYSMVSNLLDIARLEEGRLPLVKEPLRPDELIRESLARLLVSVRSKGLTFSEQYPGDDAATFMGDRSLLTRVLQNLLTNAIRFSPDGETISVGYSIPGPRRIEFFVRDNGPGVAEAYRETIFDKYSRLDHKNDGRVYSTGLGLAFCKLAVQAHRGSIGVESDGRSGSRFFFSLPQAATDE